MIEKDIAENDIRVEMPEVISANENLPQEVKEEAHVAIANAPQSEGPIIFNGQRVVSILCDDKETETEFHCQLDDGSEAMVPKSMWEIL